ncbi:MAG: hypothetical protein JF617_01975 [Burkholderiales bacterium]|nr:hypothetical protein [Burkholderiales bacterium]
MVIAVPTAASATTECTAKVIRIWAGDGGHVYIFLSGGAAVLTPSDPNREAALSLAITAMTTNRTLTVRYSADAASCSATHFDVVGLYINP